MSGDAVVAVVSILTGWLLAGFVASVILFRILGLRFEEASRRYGSGKRPRALPPALVPGPRVN